MMILCLHLSKLNKTHGSLAVICIHQTYQNLWQIFGTIMIQNLNACYILQTFFCVWTYKMFECWVYMYLQTSMTLSINYNAEIYLVEHSG